MAAGNSKKGAKLFGTDGIRGVANEYPMTGEVAMAVGRAVAHVLQNAGLTSSLPNSKSSIPIVKRFSTAGNYRLCHSDPGYLVGNGQLVAGFCLPDPYQLVGFWYCGSHFGFDRAGDRRISGFKSCNC